jgi:hypothetical protein
VNREKKDDCVDIEKAALSSKLCICSAGRVKREDKGLRF